MSTSEPAPDQASPTYSDVDQGSPLPLTPDQNGPGSPSILAQPDQVSQSVVVPESPDREDFNIEITHRPRRVQPVVAVNEGDNRNDPLRLSMFSNITSPNIIVERIRRRPSGEGPLRRTREVFNNNEDSNNTISSASEESNQSLPESRVLRNSKDKSLDEPPAKIRKCDENEDLDGETCPICLDTWGNSGDHRLVALKCGHLFGSQCVERWLKAQAAKDRTCPTCKSKASLKDLRFIYARRLIAADTSQITSLQKQVETLQAEKSRTEIELQKTKIAHKMCATQLAELKNSLLQSQNVKQQPTKKTWRFALEKNLEIYRDGGCRVLTYNCRTYELYVSQKSANYLFPGYGIRKVSCVDYTLGQFVHLHPKPIRDITYSQPRDLLLSVSLDGTARIVDRGIPNVTVNAGFPLWSCAWDHHRTNLFYLGGVGGAISQYDFRNPSTKVQTLESTGDISPVISICSTEFGLLTCQLNSCWLWELKDGLLKPRMLPVEGSYRSLSYDHESQRALISIRPSVDGTERSKLAVLKFKSHLQTGTTKIEVVDMFDGSARSSLMSRATFCKVPGATWVAAHSESDSTLYLHGLDDARTMSLPAAEPALDVCSIQLNGNTILASLSEYRLRLYKAVATIA